MPRWYAITFHAAVCRHKRALLLLPLLLIITDYYWYAFMAPYADIITPCATLYAIHYYYAHYMFSLMPCCHTITLLLWYCWHYAGVAALCFMLLLYIIYQRYYITSAIIIYFLRDDAMMLRDTPATPCRDAAIIERERDYFDTDYWWHFIFIMLVAAAEHYYFHMPDITPRCLLPFSMMLRRYFHYYYYWHYAIFFMSAMLPAALRSAIRAIAYALLSMFITRFRFAICMLPDYVMPLMLPQMLPPITIIIDAAAKMLRDAIFFIILRLFRALPHCLLLLSDEIIAIAALLPRALLPLCHYFIDYWLFSALRQPLLTAMPLFRHYDADAIIIRWYYFALFSSATIWYYYFSRLSLRFRHIRWALRHAACYIIHMPLLRGERVMLLLLTTCHYWLFSLRHAAIIIYFRIMPAPFSRERAIDADVDAFDIYIAIIIYCFHYYYDVSLLLFSLLYLCFFAIISCAITRFFAMLR